jgi:transcription termination/antitermination protein NusG
MIVVSDDKTEELRARGHEIRGNCANWYALWVKSRHEFVIAQELDRKGITYFLPSLTRIRQWKDRKKAIAYPLFPGYLFVHIVQETGAFLNVVKIQGSVGFVSLEPGKPAAVSADEIASLKAMLSSGAQLDVFSALKVGTTVRVKRGPLCGHIGVLIKRENQHMFLINVNILGRSVGLKICTEDVEQA